MRTELVGAFMNVKILRVPRAPAVSILLKSEYTEFSRVDINYTLFLSRTQNIIVNKFKAANMRIYHE